MKLTKAAAVDRLASVLCNLFEKGESATSLAGMAAGAVSLTNPACLAIFGPIAVAVLGFQTVAAYRDWAAGKTLEEFMARTNAHADGLAAAGAWVAEREELNVPVPKRDPRYAPLAFYTLLRGEFLNAELRDRGTAEQLLRVQRTLAGVLERHEAFAASFAAGFAEQADRLDTVLREVELTRDDLTDLARETWDRLDTIDRRLDHAPPLTLPSASAAAGTDRLDLVAGDRFHYRTEQVPLFGREGLLGELDAFRGSRRRFAWWLLTGPGGAGKSRLALQVCKDARAEGWWAGFLSREHGTDGGYDGWHEWTPRRPTLAVIDYVAARHERVAAWLARLAERADGFEHPVRLLLLERSAEETDPWYKHLVGGATASAGSRRDTRFRTPREVPPLTDDDLWNVLAHVWTALEHPHPDWTEALDTLREIDPDGRPLFAAFYAEAVAGGLGNDGTWNPRTLTEAILEREVGGWRAAGFDGEHANLLTLATMAGPISVGDLGSLTDDQGPLPIPAKRDYDPDAFARMNGFAAADAAGDPAPFEPDLLGECFVLNRLGGELRVTAKNEHALRDDGDRLVEWAWRKRPDETAAFTARAFRDFPDGPERAGAPTPLGRLMATPVVDVGHDARVTALVGSVAHIVRSVPDPEAVDGWLQWLISWGADDDQLAEAYWNCGTAWAGEPEVDLDAAVRAFATVADDLIGASPGWRAGALLERGRLHATAGRDGEALADFSQLIDDLDGAPPELVAEARIDRADLAWRDDPDKPDQRTWDWVGEEYDDITSQFESLPLAVLARAHFRRGAYLLAEGNKTAFVHLDFAIRTKNVPGPIAAEAALFVAGHHAYLAGVHGKNTQVEWYLNLVVSECPGARPDQIAAAHLQLSCMYNSVGRWKDALHHLEHVPDGFSEDKPVYAAEALIVRALSRGTLTADARRLARPDYTRVADADETLVKHPGLVAEALLLRASLSESEDPPDFEAATEDYSRVIDAVPGASAGQVAIALLERGAAAETGDPPDCDAAAADYTRLIERLPDAPAKQVVEALLARAAIREGADPPDRDGACDDLEAAAKMAEAHRFDSFANLARRGLARLDARD